MPTIQARYVGNLRTEATHLQSGNTIITDAPTDNHGKGEAFSPTDLVCAALGSCMMTIMAIAAQKENIDLTGVTYQITKHMTSQPRKIKQIDIVFEFPNHNYTETQKQFLQQIAHTCPVGLSLHPDIVQNIVFNFA
ncbi:MAG: OsmC family protein [Microscillaceae bacterium]|nr:OsmC family protein [Microscillaceae bacterium]MDW8460201.1 OsmC family protein [Cytophagales bacterium]